MKKVTLILGVLLGLIFLIGCTDESKELEERIELENELQSTTPTNTGEIDDEDTQETGTE